MSDPDTPPTHPDPPLTELLLALVHSDGSPIGNTTLQRALEAKLASMGCTPLTEGAYWQAHAALVTQGLLVKGQGRGGSVRRAAPPTPQADLADGADALALHPQAVPEVVAQAATLPAATAAVQAPMPRVATVAQIISYRHADKRVNNPEVGMVSPATDPEAGKNRWAYDPHLDPALQFDPQRTRIEALIDDALASENPSDLRDALQELKRLQRPYLDWAGKAERTSFDIDTVSLHVHERIDPASILSAVRKAMAANGKGQGAIKAMQQAIQPGLFDAPFENLPLRDAIDFYRHERGWANRLIAGDSLLVMNSLLQKESMAGKVQMIYIDPPYGIKYGSNFQPFVGKRDVKDRADADLTQEPEMIKAFRDTWELGIHSYLTYLRDRLLLAKELLSETGSVFVQISDENLHLIRNLLDEVMGESNYCSTIQVQKTGSQEGALLGATVDFLVWYAKDKSHVRYHQLYLPRQTGDKSLTRYDQVEFPSGASRRFTKAEHLDPFSKPVGRAYQFTSLISDGQSNTGQVFTFHSREFQPKSTSHWKTSVAGLDRVAKTGRIFEADTTIRYKRYLDDFPVVPVDDHWESMQIGKELTYVVQTADRVIERCILMTTDPGDLVFDPTCGSGTTAYVAEKWGRRWITCDTSRVAVTLAKQRLMTASFDYYALKYPHEGLKGGFVYKTVPHVTLKSIANNPEIDTIYGRLHPGIEAALANFNAALAACPPTRPFVVTEGVRKGQKLVFGMSPPLPACGRGVGGEGEAEGTALLEWEVPFDFPPDWPASIQPLWAALHAARQKMQAEMDRSIAAHADQETLFDQPEKAKDKLRITGPFTVEAVPFPSVKSLDEASGPEQADASIARTGESGRQHQWRDELLKTGIRGKGGQRLQFADLEALPSADRIRNLHASGHLDTGERVVVSFGPEHGALEPRQVSNAMYEAGTLFPLPKMLVFCAFAFDPEAAKDIDAIQGITALKAQMNTDLLTEDLKKARTSNQSFWLMGQPEVEVRRVFLPSPAGGKGAEGEEKYYQVEVHGFDYFDTVKGELVSGGKNNIAMWALDTDYDERSLFPKQVFFPMAGKGEGWEKLKKDIRAELDESLLQAFHGTVSLPFAAGDNRKIAVKIVDDRGIESLKVMNLEG
ncbi:site-specific DNA-methyltransferase [Candidatus Symbiobacter mobilis]|uniref:site-specific DNA-methyltransferase (adenine-specific) n=1 Tax=Candidatus Symbiobacter mobilis CR TaxID=946483 RepID=U5N806_9BURK|nr:site-specific DNA-methyltransferase [Candidatus Symbiobacter mobilis]AGX87430.1 DNA methylase [Candidatus Symbiobacter mobilis CR]